MKLFYKMRKLPVIIVLITVYLAYPIVIHTREYKNYISQKDFELMKLGPNKLLYLLVPVVLISGYRIMADHFISKEEHITPRNSETGIIIGAEARDLGPPDSQGAVLLVHGYAGAGNNFNYLPDRLAIQGWRVRVMRIPGHGTSPRDLEHQTYENIYDAVFSEVDTLLKYHKKVILVGHSMGATLCTLAASERQVDGLVLGAPYFGITFKWFYVLKPRTWSLLLGPALRWAYKGKLFCHINNKEVRDKIILYTWLPIKSAKILFKLSDLAEKKGILGKVTCPVLFIHSQGDNAASIKAAEKAFKAIGSEEKYSIRLKTSHHHIFWDYEHEEVIEEIVEFIGLPPEKQ